MQCHFRQNLVVSENLESGKPLLRKRNGDTPNQALTASYKKISIHSHIHMDFTFSTNHIHRRPCIWSSWLVWETLTGKTAAICTQYNEPVVDSGYHSVWLPLAYSPIYSPWQFVSMSSGSRSKSKHRLQFANWNLVIKKCNGIKLQLFPSSTTSTKKNAVLKITWTSRFYCSSGQGISHGRTSKKLVPFLMSLINKLSTVAKALKTAAFQQHQIHCETEKEGRWHNPRKLQRPFQIIFIMKMDQDTKSCHQEPPLMLNGLKKGVQTVLCAPFLD